MRYRKSRAQTGTELRHGTLDRIDEKKEEHDGAEHHQTSSRHQTAWISAAKCQQGTLLLLFML